MLFLLPLPAKWKPGLTSLMYLVYTLGLLSCAEALSCLPQGCTAHASVIRADQWDPAHRTKALPSNLCYSGTLKQLLWTDSGLMLWAECPAGFGAMRYFPAVCCLGFLAKRNAVDMLWQPHFTYFSLYWGAMKKLISKAPPCQNYIITVSVVSRPSGANLILCWSSINTYHIIALWWDL